MSKDSRSLTEEEVDRIAESVLQKISEEDQEPHNEDQDGWYPGKYASMFVEQVTKGATHGQATAIQDDLRKVGERFFQRNAIYKTNIQKAGRVAVPDPEMEVLGLEGGETVQVILFPIEKQEHD